MAAARDGESVAKAAPAQLPPHQDPLAVAAAVAASRMGELSAPLPPDVDALAAGRLALGRRGADAATGEAEHRAEPAVPPDAYVPVWSAAVTQSDVEVAIGKLPLSTGVGLVQLLSMVAGALALAGLGARRQFARLNLPLRFAPGSTLRRSALRLAAYRHP
jgi:hypothetical protein